MCIYVYRADLLFPMSSALDILRIQLTHTHGLPHKTGIVCIYFSNRETEGLSKTADPKPQMQSSLQLLLLIVWGI